MRRLYLLGVAAVVLVVLPFVLSDFRTVQLATAGAYSSRSSASTC